MYFYRTTATDLADRLAEVRREGQACEAEAMAFAQRLGADSFIPAVGSEYGGVSALTFPRSTVHKQLFDIEKRFAVLRDDAGNGILSSNGTPFFTVNYTLSEEAMRYDRAQRFANRADKIVSPGKLAFSAVLNMMSRTQIIKEHTGRKPRYSNEYQILNGAGKFLYQHARAAARAVSREHEEQWLDTYSKLRTKADWRNMFPHGLTSDDYDRLVKSREELTRAIDALGETDWSIVVTINTGEGVTSQEARNEVIRMAREQYMLPVVTYGSTHTILGAALPSENPYRPATFRVGQTEYIQIREEATAPGLEPITAEEYQQALDSIKSE